MKLRITTLSENAASRASGVDFLAEWGLSILVETDEANVLLDTGRGGRTVPAIYNADSLGVDLAKIDKIVLSHGHADHTGGLRAILRRIRKKEIEVIAHPDVWAARYNRYPGQVDRFTGIPFQRKELEGFGAAFNLTTRSVKISENTMTSGEIPMVTNFEEVYSSGPIRLIERDTGLEPDRYLDDQAVIITTEQGLVVITGCAHRGIINTLYHAQQITGVEAIHALIGGGHLVDASEERLWLTIGALKELNVQKLGLCHCTGLPAITLMAHEFGDIFFFNNAGTIVDLP